MEKILLEEKHLALFEQGNKIYVNDDECYMNYPYWIKIIKKDIDTGRILCEIYNKTELPIKKGYKKGGLQASKYIISKADGSEIDPDAWYFVLRVDDDPHAQKAAIAYAQSVEGENPLLAKELIEQVRSYQ
jgi:hypothetical protein